MPGRRAVRDDQAQARHASRAAAQAHGDEAMPGAQDAHARVMVDARTNYNEFDYRPPLLPILYAAGYLVWNDNYVANVVQGIASTLAVWTRVTLFNSDKVANAAASTLDNPQVQIALGNYITDQLSKQTL